jgi:glutamine amidotransferase
MSVIEPKVAIVDFGLGNLYSVSQACAKAGFSADITSSPKSISEADAVILPGVGAFGDAMAALHRLDLVSVLRDVAASEKPLIGICLGMQLLMSESTEFGHHEGLDIIPGSVRPFEGPTENGRRLKIPQIGWNRINNFSGLAQWKGSLLTGISEDEYMYFVHSYIVDPADKNIILSTSRYGQIEFCSSLQKNNIFACQFHPERSGYWGIRMYENIAVLLDRPA